MTKRSVKIDTMEDNKDISSEGECTKIVQDLIFSDNTRENISRIYKEWARRYDNDMNAYISYKSREVVAEALSELCAKKKDIRILDLGAGTGFVGEELKNRGFTNIDAIDASAEMLEVAHGKGIYQNFICDYLGPNRLHIQDDTYDAMVAAGVFVPNHMNDSCFEELIRICKPGGVMVFIVVHKHLQEIEFRNRFEPRILQFEEQGAWKWVERKLVENLTNVFNKIQVSNRDSRGVLYILEKET